MKCFDIYSKLRERWIGFHTSMVGKKLGAYGGACRIEPPILINRPERVFVGRGSVLCTGLMLACVENGFGEKGRVGEIHFGADCHIRENVQITAADRVDIGERVAIGRNCLISDHDHGYEDITRHILDNPLTPPRSVVLEDGCMLGSCVRVAPGVRIGRHALVGFGSVVTRDLPAYSVAIGSPARVIRRYNFDTKQWEACRPEQGD